ncbi:MAG: DUF2147 domain-containing protein [Pseudomonadota bacterium]
MRRFAMAAAAALMCTTAQADDVFGLWKSAVNDEGNFIHVEIGACTGDAAKVCGIIKDALNVDPAQTNVTRQAELKGKTIIANMVPDGPNEWDGGTIWAPDDDETYDSTMELKGNVLEVSGCVLGGIICRGQDWTRLN